MKRSLFYVPLCLSLSFYSACDVEEDGKVLQDSAPSNDDRVDAEPEDPDAEFSPLADGLLSIEEPEADAVGDRLCSSSEQCNPNGCDCDGTKCVPGQVPGPPAPNPPPVDCVTPPKRACTKASDCRSGCGCTAGLCKATGSPQSQVCHLPPLDPYENDNTWTTASAYGSFQVGHTFHEPGDVDWVAVWINSPMLATFQTYDATADTYLHVYEYNEVNKQLVLVKENDDVCYPKLVAQCRTSKVQWNVSKPSGYYIKITQKHIPPYNEYATGYPKYSFKIF